MNGGVKSTPVRARLLPSSRNELTALCGLGVIGAIIAGLTLATPFAFKSAGDNAYIALAIPAGLLALAATVAAERTPTTRTLWLIIGFGIALRIIALSWEPLLSSDIYRYVWDGQVQAAGINPYRYVPADPALAALRDAAIFPRINRADSAVTIYPPVAQMFFLLVTRFGASTLVMRLALLACEAVSVAVILLLLKRLQRPPTRVVAYLWHPLPVWEVANGGHVDALMVCLMLLGLWLAIDGRPVRGAVVLALGVLVKPFAAPALAVIWRPWNWKMPLAVIAAVALCYAPYLSVGWNVFGFLTHGYLNEEGLVSGAGFWLLALWRLAFGAHQGDIVVYMALAALLLLTMAARIWQRPTRTPATDLADINTLLLAILLVLSPNHPWYFLVIVPFLALAADAPIAPMNAPMNAPTWAASIGALLLTYEVEGFHVPMIVLKSVLFGAVLLTAAWSLRAAYWPGPSGAKEANEHLG